ncbi:chorismate mutase 2-like [Magnolia sinica]|uniref:chorismate mutase 2-like n=1 Tax=Magnolia sinica TaxID=86752 RepID=UPI0026599163|nr:chorismate mutase 2-like [Magnolia sinica]
MAILNQFRIFSGIPFWVLIFTVCSCRICSSALNTFTLDSVREALIREEDTIVFSLIERAKFPRNSLIYDESKLRLPGFCGSFLKFFVKDSEILHAKAGRYQSPVERPFFSSKLPWPLLPPRPDPQVLHPAAAASINVSKTILNVYVDKVLPLFTTNGDDGNYAVTAASDLACLQAMSRRIHYGMFVAEPKFRDAPQDYGPAIRAKDRDALMKLLTSESVEELIKKRVKKKAMMFGQEVGLGDKSNKPKYKINPSAVSHLYGKWVMPLTKLVEVEYLLRRLD